MVMESVKMNKALIARNISRKYDNQVVLEDFSLEVEQSGFVSIMGPSGCGKSTFLNIAAGLIGADSGECFVDGEDILKMSDSQVTKFRRRNIGIVFQEFNLIESKTVLENILLPIKLDGSKPSLTSLQKIAYLLGLEEKLSVKAELLSGGEKQRVAIARALITEPKLILADEPTGSLDPRSARQICDLLRRLNEVSKSAIVLITHDPMVAATAKEVNFLNHGRIVSHHDTNFDASLVSNLYLETYK
jgi:putative ABC transport system ATP-binding protein